MRVRDARGLTTVALSADGRSLYLLGGVTHTLVVFARDPASGRLRQLRGVGSCVSAKPRAGCTVGRALSRIPDSLLVSRDGRSVYVVEQDDDIGVFRRDRASGRLRQLPGLAGCLSSRARDGCGRARALRGGRATLSPDERELYVASAAYDSDAVLTFSRDLSTGALTQLAGLDGCSSSYPGHGCRHAWALDNPAAVTFSADGAWGYAAAREGSVALFSRDLSDGHLLEPAPPFGCWSSYEPGILCARTRPLGGANDVLVAPDGRAVYVASFEHGVEVFARDPQTGRLGQLAGRDGCVSSLAGRSCRRARGIRTGGGQGTEALSLSHDGRTLYASSPIFGRPFAAIAVLRRDAQSGALHALAGADGCVGEGRGCARVRGISDPGDVVLSPDGRFAYVPDAGFVADGLAVFRVVGA
jgi:6-phosphogluconolactonase (cycloisomerase 2 family)